MSHRSFLMLLSFVMPEIVLGISLFLVFQFVLTFVELGTKLFDLVFRNQQPRVFGIF